MTVRGREATELGASDVAQSKRFYLKHGFTLSKSYGARYAEFDTGPIKLSLNSRDAVAKTAGVAPDGNGSHRLIIDTDGGALADPDGFTWGVAAG